MEDFYLIIVSAFVGASSGLIANIGLESLRHKNAVSKTVQDKLHCDRAEVIKELFRKLVRFEHQLHLNKLKLGKYDREQFNKDFKAIELFIDENALYFSDNLRKSIYEFEEFLRLEKRKINSLKQEQFEAGDYSKYLADVTSMRVDLEIEFAALLGVKIEEPKLVFRLKKLFRRS